MNAKGQNNEKVKINNRASTLALLLANGPMSRSEIAAALALTPATVTAICGEFLKKNLLIQHSESDSNGRVGRKKSPVEFNCDYKRVLAVNITPNATDVSICDLYGRPQDSLRIATDTGCSPERFLARVADRCIKLLWNNRLDNAAVLGVGVTVIGPVNDDDGVSLNAFRVWNGAVPVREILERELRLPVRVESNVCALAGASLLYGEVKESNFLAVKWGPGVGSASVIDGIVFKGRGWQSAELGHNFVDAKGEKCRCGKVGCLETKVSLEAIALGLKKLARAPEAKTLRQILKKPTLPEMDNLSEILAIGHKPLDDFMNDLSYRLAVVVNNAMQILVPDKIVLFGDVFRDDDVFDRFRSHVFAINPLAPEDVFLRSALEEKKNHIGAAACVVKRLLVDTGGPQDE